jgi:undecaprenyl diphosphate synthase
MQEMLNKLSKENLPEHIAVIMDGNGRWATEKGQNRIYGHQHGVEAVRQTVEGCAEFGIKYLTLYAFSTENWQRPKDEIIALMELLVSTLRSEISTLNKNNIRLHSIGNLQDLPEKCFNELMECIRGTENNTGLNLILALSYSARWDILNAVKLISNKHCNGELDVSAISDEDFKSHLTTNNFPYPELLIRTSGEKRISNFLLWEIAYSELYFCSKHWPDFNKEELLTAILDYQKRERRFGKTSDQIKS